MAKRILGLDIGSHSVKAVEFRQTLRDVEVVQLRQLPIFDPAPSLGGELREFLQAHDLPIENVVVSLSGDRVSTRRLSFPFRDRKKIGPAVPFEVESQVPFDLDDFFVDWEIVGESKVGSDVVATLAPRSEVSLLIETLRDAGLSPKVVEAEGLVLSNLTQLFDLGGTRILVDIGHRKTTLCLCWEGRAVAARTVPIAGRAITQAIASERGLGEVEAERIKMEDGILAGPSASAGALEVVDRLARELVRTLGSLETLLGEDGNHPLQEITLVGGSAHLHRVDEYLHSRTGLPVRKLALPPAGTNAAIVAAGDPQLFAPALALAVRGSSQAKTRMNFRQDDLAVRMDFRAVGREFRWTGVLAAAAVVLAFVGVGVDAYLGNRRASEIEQSSFALYHDVNPGGSPPRNLLRAMQDAVQKEQNRADTLGVYRGNLSALDVLTEVSARLPKQLNFVFEEFSVDRQVVQIKGHSPSAGDVDRLRSALAKYPPFAEITIGDINSDPRRGGQNFRVRISLAAEGSS
jgi:general secretion pathway protein L